MRVLATTAAVILAVVVTVPALGQGTPAAPAASAKKAGQAPTGHRQPRAQDTRLDQTPPSEETSKQLDRELDRKLKGICRGC